MMLTSLRKVSGWLDGRLRSTLKFSRDCRTEKLFYDINRRQRAFLLSRMNVLLRERQGKRKQEEMGEGGGRMHLLSVGTKTPIK